MTISDLLQLLLWLLGGLLAVIGGLLPRAYDKQQSLTGKCFIFGLGIVCGVLLVVFGKLISIPQVEHKGDWLVQAYLTLGVGYIFAVPTTMYLFKTRPGGNAEPPDDTEASYHKPLEAESEPEISNAEPLSDTTPTISPQTLEYWRWELLKILEADVQEQLEDSLPNEESMSLLVAHLGEGESPEPARVSTNLASLRQCLQPKRALKILGVTQNQLDPDQKLIDVFERDHIGRRLLIVGATGSGKTTTLLELAQDLIQRAQQHPEQPIPVVFELSDWPNDEQPIAEWLAEDLRFRNNIPEAITQEWINTGQLLPLLDGLDELGLTQRVKCFEKMNALLQAGSGETQFVICCSEEEFIAAAAMLERLRGSICLQPLSEGQIQDYLRQLECEHLWQPIKNDPEGLLELAKTPLLLQLIPIAYPNGLRRQERRFSNLKRRQEYQEKCRQGLFDAYILRRLEADQDSQGYTQEQTIGWLVWLAKTLKQQSQTEFAIEKMQPYLLVSSKQKLLYFLSISLIVGVIIGSVVAQISYLFFGGLFGDIFGGVFRDIFGLASGIIGGLFLGFNYTNQPIDPNTVASFSWEKTLDGLMRGLSGGLIGGLIGGVVFGLFGELFFGLMFGIFFGLIFGSIYNLVFGGNRDEIKTRHEPNQGIKTSTQNLAIISVISFPACVLAFVLPSLAVRQTVEPVSALMVGLGLALFLGINFGGLAAIQHCVLRLILWRSGVIPWNYARFLSYVTERRLMQQVGGRYRFIHNLLRDHFAKLPES